MEFIEAPLFFWQPVETNEWVDEKEYEESVEMGILAKHHIIEIWAIDDETTGVRFVGGGETRAEVALPYQKFVRTYIWEDE